MKASLILFGVLLFKNFQTSFNTPLLYTEITDCGDGKFSNFVVSITPNPLQWVSPSESVFWGGIRLSFTEEASILASNISTRDFVKDMQVYYILEEPLWASIPPFLQSQLEKINITEPCETLFAPGICSTVQQGMISKLTNSTLFFSFELGNTPFELMSEVVDYFINLVQNGTFSCPDNSKEINNSSCQCNPPFSGPLCSFHCQYDEIRWFDCVSWPEEDGVTCTFMADDYVKYCIKENIVQLLSGPITVDNVSLNHINIKWKLVNIPAGIYTYELTLKDNTEILGSIFYTALNMDGLETSYSLGSLCLNETIYGVDCRNTTFDGQSCYDCPDLSLNVFHDYTIILKLGDSNGLVAAVNFTTPEDPEANVMAPKITSTALDDDQNCVSVNWMLTQDWCLGIIRRYELIVSCHSDHAISSGNLSFDCRSGFQGPKLDCTIPTLCKREDTFIKLRIGTASSMSDESEQFLLKYEAWSTWVIIAYVLGTLLITVAIGLVIFFYYYKRHVKTYQNVYQIVRNLLHAQRKSEIGQSLRARIAPKSTIPELPASEGSDSAGGTVFQTIAATPEVGSPRSLQNNEIQNETTSTTSRDSLGYKLFELI